MNGMHYSLKFNRTSVVKTSFYNEAKKFENILLLTKLHFSIAQFSSDWNAYSFINYYIKLFLVRIK